MERAALVKRFDIVRFIYENTPGVHTATRLVQLFDSLWTLVRWLWRRNCCLLGKYPRLREVLVQPSCARTQLCRWSIERRASRWGCFREVGAVRKLGTDEENLAEARPTHVDG